MSFSRTASLAFLAITLGIFSSACHEHDYFSEVAKVCQYYDEPSVLLEEENLPIPTIKEECRKALEKILPFDESWASAPKGVKESVLHAFHVVIAYPLALPPQNRILGHAPYSIPLWSLRLIEQYENPNKSLFNHMLDTFQTIRFVSETKTSPGVEAQWTPKIIFTNGYLSITERFLSDIYFGKAYTGGFARAGLLAHESRHGDGIFHESCEDGSFECDPQLSGAYGSQVFYWELILHGSGNKGPHGKPPLLNDLDILCLGSNICSLLKSRFSYLPKDLREFLESFECFGKDARFYSDAEGLIRDFGI